MLRMLMTVLKWLVRLCVWIFVVGSLASLIWLLHPQYIMSEDSGFTMMSIGKQSAWGLTYQGAQGSVLAFSEMIVVAAGLIASLSRRLITCMLGHLVLISWIALWTGNAFYLFSDGQFGMVYVLPFFLLCFCMNACFAISARTKRVEPPEAQLQAVGE